MFSTDSELNRFQEVCLGILKATAKLCDEKGLTYYLCGGTLLGAIRHQGFIPWDDDIDIAMPRKDYEKLLSMGDALIDGRYRIYHYSFYEEKPNCHTIQIIDTKAHVIREWTAEKKEIPIWVDVFPLDGLCENKLLQECHYYRYHFYQFLMQIANKENAINIRKQRGFLQRLFIWFIFTFNVGKNWNVRKLLDKMEEIVKHYPWDCSTYLSSFHGTLGKKEILKREWYEQRSKLPFEDQEYYVPQGYDEIMRHYYGDYMIPVRRSYEHEFSDLRISEDGKENS